MNSRAFSKSSLSSSVMTPSLGAGDFGARSLPAKLNLKPDPSSAAKERRLLRVRLQAMRYPPLAQRQLPASAQSLSYRVPVARHESSSALFDISSLSLVP